MKGVSIMHAAFSASEHKFCLLDDQGKKKLKKKNQFALQIITDHKRECLLELIIAVLIHSNFFCCKMQ